MRRIGIIGCGAIGSLITEAVDNGIIECDELILYDHDMDKAEALQESLSTASVVVSNIEEMLQVHPYVIVEAASQEAAREYIGAIVDAGIEIIVMSVGALLDMNIKQELVVFEGDAREAVRHFPREMNVAASLALTVQPQKLLVRLISDPRETENTHEISVKWRYGSMLLKFNNDPHPENPKTSALAAWSAIRLLKGILEKLP